MAVTIRNCLVCNSPMQCKRANKLICSSHCHSKLHKARAKLGFTTEQMLEYLKQEQERSHDTQ